MCNRAFAKASDQYILHTFFFENYDTIAVDIAALCDTINEVAKNISLCMKESYLQNKTDVKFSSVIYDSTNIFFPPRQKAKYYLDNFPDIKTTCDFYEYIKEEHKDNEVFQFNKKELNNLLDNPSFIKAIYNYLWACIYSYDIITLWISDFIDFVIESVNSKTRKNYIICDCRESLKKDKIIVNENVQTKSMYDYTCGRALGIINDSKSTVFVIYNTISSENDFMDETYFKTIQLSNSRSKSSRSKSSRSKSSRISSLNKTQTLLHNQQIKPTKIYVGRTRPKPATRAARLRLQRQTQTQKVIDV
jgi:hypothetical protein